MCGQNPLSYDIGCMELCGRFYGYGQHTIFNKKEYSREEATVFAKGLVLKFLSKLVSALLNQNRQALNKMWYRIDVNAHTL